MCISSVSHLSWFRSFYFFMRWSIRYLPSFLIWQRVVFCIIRPPKHCPRCWYNPPCRLPAWFCQALKGTHRYGEPLIKNEYEWENVHAHKTWFVRSNETNCHFLCAVNDKNERFIALATSEWNRKTYKWKKLLKTLLCRVVKWSWNKIKK